MTTFTASRFIAKNIDENGNARYVAWFDHNGISWATDINEAVCLARWRFEEDFRMTFPGVKIELIKV